MTFDLADLVGAIIGGLLFGHIIASLPKKKELIDLQKSFHKTCPFGNEECPKCHQENQ